MNRPEAADEMRQIDVDAGPTGETMSRTAGSRTLPYTHAFAGEPPRDPVLDAAATCVERNGFDATSLEQVAAEAGVSRTTLYRRFGNREALFTALLVQRSQPFVRWSRAIAMGPGTAIERLEKLLVGAVIEMQQLDWLDVSLHSGMSAASARLFKAAQRQTSRESMGQLVATIHEQNAADTDVTLDELREWVVDQMILLASEPAWTDEGLRRRLRYFVLPVLRFSPHNDSDQRLAAIEKKLDALAACLGRGGE